MHAALLVALILLTLSAALQVTRALAASGRLTALSAKSHAPTPPLNDFGKWVGPVHQVTERVGLPPFAARATRPIVVLLLWRRAARVVGAPVLTPLRI